MAKRRKSPKHSKLPYVIGVIIILILLGSLYLYHTHHKKKPIASVDQYTKGQASEPNNSSSTSTQSTTTPTGTKSGNSSATLVAPTGDFVSDHHPNLSGSPAPSSMTSVCNTTPGATCQISFTNGSTTKTLAAQVTDPGGVTYWYWKLQDINLTIGSWTVTATSSLNGSSLTATDPMALVVAE